MNIINTKQKQIQKINTYFQSQHKEYSHSTLPWRASSLQQRNKHIEEERLHFISTLEKTITVLEEEKEDNEVNLSKKISSVIQKSSSLLNKKDHDTYISNLQELSNTPLKITLQQLKYLHQCYVSQQKLSVSIQKWIKVRNQKPDNLMLSNSIHEYEHAFKEYDELTQEIFPTLPNAQAFIARELVNSGISQPYLYAEIIFNNDHPANHVSSSDSWVEIYDAIKHEDEDRVKFYLSIGADPHDNFARSVSCKNINIFRILLAAGANVNYHGSWLDYHSSALMTAARERKTELVRILLSLGADVNLEDSNYNTALTESLKTSDSENIDIEIVYMLLAAGANVNHTDSYGNKAPLFIAIQSESYNAIRLLLKAGANVNYRDESGDTPLFEAIPPRNHSRVAKPEIVSLLLESGADVNMSNYKFDLPSRFTTPLIRAVEATGAKGGVDIVEMLLQHEADYLLKNDEKETAEDISIRACQEAVEINEYWDNRKGVEHTQKVMQILQKHRKEKERTAVCLLFEKKFQKIDVGLAKWCSLFSKKKNNILLDNPYADKNVIGEVFKFL